MNFFGVFSVGESYAGKRRKQGVSAIEGLAAFNKVTAESLFGADNPVLKEQRICTLRSN
ncbi:hypothetical protein BVRB_2g032440 [Beta vulgaris subsp. vulgaris]|nr:hypothetical protein BVRB_2g032440 [Beta vulgaris subsp. vulgaris]